MELSTIFKILFFIISIYLSPVEAGKCYSCAGTCHSEPCNCQMGSCEADYCFTERKPTEIRGIFRITKGCLKRPSRTHHGCDYDHFPDHIQCVCAGDFCNDVVYIRPQFRRNITCRQCTEREPDCSDTCQGQWCHEDTATGSTGCGYGPPSLPFFYKGPELLFHRSKICITMSRGNNAKPRRHCICNTHMCNDLHKQPFIYDGLSQIQPSSSKYSQESDSTGQPRSRSLVTYNYATHRLPLHKCVSCDTTAQDNAMTSSCKQQHCHGHFCTLAAQRIIMGINSGPRMGAQAILHEKQGCINVTDNFKIHLGCSHKWMNNEEEELLCACTGDNCNKDLTTASLSGSNNRSFSVFVVIFAAFFSHVL